jgi:hypothetical protein
LIFLCAEEERVGVTAVSASAKQRDVQYCNVFRFVCQKGKLLRHYERRFNSVYFLLR